MNDNVLVPGFFGTEKHLADYLAVFFKTRLEGTQMKNLTDALKAHETTDIDRINKVIREHIAESENKTDYQRKSERKKLLPFSHSFNWALPNPMSGEEGVYLIKGVAATEGDFKSGDRFTPENLTFAAGAMSTAGWMGIGVIDIDHFHDRLPERYAKYGLEGVHGEIGYLLDASVEINKVVDGEGRMKDLAQVEFIGYTTNKKVADLINEGKIIGTSVEDWARGAECSDEIAIGCEISGSHFFNLGLILDEVPDSHGTWVGPVSDEDLRKWEKNAERLQEAMDVIIVGNKKAYKIRNADYKKAMDKKHDLSEFMDERGNFYNGKAGIIDYLTTEISVDDVMAEKIADYLISHPGDRNQWQMEMMSAGDWYAWFNNIAAAELESLRTYHTNTQAVLKRHGIDCKECGREKTAHETVDMPDSGQCPEGFRPINDGTQCSDGEDDDGQGDEEPEIIPMPDEGCASGWEPGEDADGNPICIRVAEGGDDSKGGIPVIDIGRFMQKLKAHKTCRLSEKTERQMKIRLEKRNKEVNPTAETVKNPKPDRTRCESDMQFTEESMDVLDVDAALRDLDMSTNRLHIGRAEVSHIIHLYRKTLKRVDYLQKKEE